MTYTKRRNCLLTCIGVFFLLLPILSFAKDYGPELGPYSNKNRFKHDREYSKKYPGFRFTPVRNDVVAYDKSGKSFKLSLTDTVKSDGIYNGSYAGKSGKWILFYMLNRQLSGHADSYVFLDDVKEVEEAAKLSDVTYYAAVEKMQKEARDRDDARDKERGKYSLVFIGLFALAAIAGAAGIRYFVIWKWG